MKVFILLGVVFNLSLISCQSACNDFKSCGECIEHAKERCVWCAQDVMGLNKTRCQPQKFKNHIAWCPSHEIQDPKSEEPKPIRNEDFSAATGKEIQLRPQKIELKLRPGEPVSIKMAYQPAKDYPLDMYFLMDNSFTMQKHAAKLATQTMNIYHALKNMTNNVRLGLGTFVEKPALPYSDPRTKNSYVFQHHLSLTENTTLFKDKVNSYYENVGSNYDSPESGLDALMQVMECQNEIGWRNKLPTGEGTQSRKIIIVATDATYHSAGDGKMIGAYKTNDMKCHLNSENRYDEQISLTTDYPSVSQISYVAKKNNIKIVFAVLENIAYVYEALVKEIYAAEYVELKDDMIVKIIEDTYNSASRKVRLDVPSNLPSIKVKIDCGDCLSTQKKPVVNISAEVIATSCEAKLPDFNISVIGIADKLEVKVVIECCPCENESISVSDDCSKAGRKLCGVCKCDSDRSGERCETKCNDKQELELMEKCKQYQTDVAYCNGRGDCMCGKCHCTNEADYSGEFCQFNEIECRKDCPADKGDCKLGVCTCKDTSQWTGPHCGCPLSNQTCIGPFSEQPCSGRGDCNCGQCKCSGDHYGLFCELCKDCAKDLCELLKEYAICSHELTPKADCDIRYTNVSVEKVTIMNKTELEGKTSATACRKKVEDGHILVYKFEITTNDDTKMAKLELMIQNDLESPPVANIWIAVGGVIGGVLFVGLLTLIIWKIVTSIYDKREYEKFCAEATSAGFDVKNPVYLDPTVNFSNPAYTPKEDVQRPTK